MFIFLNPPKAFWAIPDTDIILSRSEPYTEITEEDLASLTKEQIDIMRASRDNGTITEVREEFVPKIKSGSMVDIILSMPVREMQRHYVSKLEHGQDIKTLETLLEEEKGRENRVAVTRVLSAAIDRVKSRNPELELYSAITEEIVDVDDYLKEREEVLKVRDMVRNRK